MASPLPGTIAVIGGTGFLGRHVVAALAAAGHTVRALSRRSGFDVLRPDAASLSGLDAVVNLAGIKREEGPQTFQAVHVDAVQRLAVAMRDAGVRRLVHISVVAARDAPALPYHHTKWQGEAAVRASELDWTILRPGVIYGTGDDMLSHLALMIRASPVFPIVNDGSSPMMPVDANDVAAAVVSALASPASIARTYDVVGPDRLTLRDVVQRVAAAAGLSVAILPTPVALMALPVSLMERIARRPLSTRAQLQMLVDGLAGDPEPARRDLGLTPAPFTPERLRPLVAAITRRAPVDFRIFSAPRASPEIPPRAAAALCAGGAALVTVAFLAVRDHWLGMFVAMSLMSAAALAHAPVRAALLPRFLPRATDLLLGVVAALGLVAATLTGVALLDRFWPAWQPYGRTLYAWMAGRSPTFLLATLILIVAGEELLWRGVITRWALARFGRGAGILAGAALYALAHLGSFNPILIAAAFFCGLLWSWLHAATDRLAAPFFCHLAWDITVLFVIRLVP